MHADPSSFKIAMLNRLADGELYENIETKKFLTMNSIQRTLLSSAASASAFVKQSTFALNCGPVSGREPHHGVLQKCDEQHRIEVREAPPRGWVGARALPDGSKSRH